MRSGPTTGGANSFVAGFAAINVGSLDQTYAGGLVTGGAGSTTGGLVASNSFSYTLAARHRAASTRRAPPPIRSGTARPPARTPARAAPRPTPPQLAPGLPAGFDPAIWGTIPAQYPFLIALGPSDTTPGTPVQQPLQPQQPTAAAAAINRSSRDQPPVIDGLPSVQQVIQDFRPQAGAHST